MDTFGTIFLVIFILAGILTIIFPEYAWYLRHGIWYKDSEPTDDALLFTRIGGAALTAIGLFMIFIIST